MLASKLAGLAFTLATAAVTISTAGAEVLPMTEVNAISQPADIVQPTRSQETDPYAKPGFYTKVVDNRLWVFKPNSKELTEFEQHGEPAKSVSRIGAGPNGMTIRSGDAATIDAYLVAKPGFYTQIIDGRLWVFKEDSKDLEEFKKHGEPAKSISRIGAGPRGMTLRSGDAATLDAYLGQ